MPGFSLVPASGFPSQTPQEFPNFIQFRNGSTSLGGPDADVLAFGTGLTATRGTGENSNVVTVNAQASGDGRATPLLLQLTNGADSYFDGVASDDWSGLVLQSSEDLTWDEYGDEVNINTEGLYRVDITARITPTANVWPAPQGAWSVFGTEVANSVSNAKSRHARWSEGIFSDSDENFMQWTDTYFVNAEALPAAIRPAVYGKTYNGGSIEYNCTALVLIQRVGPPYAT